MLVYESCSYILRTRCYSTGDFSVIIKHSGLHMNEVINLRHDINTNQCKLKCVLTNGCKSFAWNQREMKCQLYKSSDQDPLDNIKLTRMDGWTYHTTFYNITEVMNNHLCQLIHKKTIKAFSKALVHRFYVKYT